MSKIENLIEGFAEMSDADKLKALTDFEFDDHTSELEKYKGLVSKANSEAAEWKKKHRELLGEEEKRKLEQEEALESMKSELATLKRDKSVSEFTAQYIAMGYDSALASATASAMVDGDMVTVLNNQAKHNAEMEKQIKAKLMRENPKPGAIGGGSPTMTLAELRKMKVADQGRFAQEHPEEYKALYGITE